MFLMSDAAAAAALGSLEEMVWGVALGPFGIALLVLTSGAAGLPLGMPAGAGDALAGCAGTPLVAVNDSMSVVRVVVVKEDSR